MKLIELFEKSETKLRNDLSSYRIPQDMDKLMLFLNDFFVDRVSVEEYKEGLSMVEVAMLNSVIKLVSSPLSLVNEWTIIDVEDVSKEDEKRKENLTKTESILQRINLPVVGSTTAGGIIGGLLFKTWGGVLFSIAGCALGMYFSSGKNITYHHRDENQQQDIRLNVEKYIDTLKQICNGIDDVMDSYHISIANIESAYAATPKSTLASTYRPLLDRMASLYVSLRNVDLPSEVQSEFDKLYRTLKNHHYEIIDYSDDTKQYYEETPSPHVSKPTIIKAAIIENGKIIESGECLVPEINR